MRIDRVAAAYGGGDAGRGGSGGGGEAGGGGSGGGGDEGGGGGERAAEVMGFNMEATTSETSSIIIFVGHGSVSTTGVAGLLARKTSSSLDLKASSVSLVLEATLPCWTEKTKRLAFESDIRTNMNSPT